MYIRDTLRLTGRRSRATNTFVERNAQTSGFALKRTEYELGPIIKIETGPVQITERVHHKRRHICCVGDDDQSIYSWRGANIANILRFEKDFSNAKVIRLEQNYRSTSTILNAANALITNNSSRMGKDLWTDGKSGEKIVVYSAFNELEEARFVSERIGIAINSGKSKDDIAILYRSNAQSRVIEEALLKAGISYRIYGGVRFFERTEVKDILAYLRLLANAHDDPAFERVVNFPTRGIGEKTLEDLRSLARSLQISLWQAAINLLETGNLAQRASIALSKFIELIDNLREKTASLELDNKISLVIQDSGLYEHFSKEKTLVISCIIVLHCSCILFETLFFNKKVVSVSSQMVLLYKFPIIVISEDKINKSFGLTL